MSNTKTTRRCEIVTNLYNNDGKKIISKEKINRVIEERGCITDFSYIIHDKDTYSVEEEDKNPAHKAGTLKTPHVHLLLRFKNPQHYKNIADWFEIPENFVNKINGKWEDAVAYQVHANAPDKYQYDISEVTANFSVEKIIKEKETRDSIAEVLHKILVGEIKEYNKTKEIDQTMLVKYYVQIERAFKIQQESRIATQKDRQTECIYIVGESGSGKTTLAKEICKERGFAYFVSSGSNDILDGYAQQEAIILDDLRPSCMPFVDLLKLLDNNTPSTVKSRYKNKVVFADLIIITSVLDLETFYNTLFSETNKEPIVQLQRRCGTHIRVEKTRLYISSWDSKRNKYTEEIEYENEILEKYVPKKEKTLDDVEKMLKSQIPFLKKVPEEERKYGFEEISVFEQERLPFEEV